MSHNKQLQQTADFVPDVPSSQSQSDSSMSQAPVGLQVGGRLHYGQEIATLLQSRLRAVITMMLVIFTLVLLVFLMTGHDKAIIIRIMVLVVMSGCLFVVRRSPSLSLDTLRWIELVFFGAISVSMLRTMWITMVSFGLQGDTVSMVSDMHAFLGAYCLLILTYGIFIPCTWQRALAVLLPIAISPYVLVMAIEWYFPDMAASMDQDRTLPVLFPPFIATAIAVYGCHTINRVRREAFDAKRLGQYYLKEKLGEGGMGEVYRAEHQLLKRPCAVKLIRPEKLDNETTLPRFEREVRATASLTHWNTVQIYDFGRAVDGTFYYVMEYLPGMDLETMVKRFGQLPAARVVHFLRQACQSLEEAHAKGLIHRDIKPGNLFVTKQGTVHDVIKMLDFGLVRDVSMQDVDAQLTQPGMFSGSPMYMCPEQFESFNRLDARSDIYSLGAVAYYMLTRRPPFTGVSPMSIIVAHSRDAVSAPSRVRDGIPEDLERLVLRCLEKDPADRYQSARELEQALAQCECAGQWTETDAEKWWSEREGE